MASLTWCYLQGKVLCRQEWFWLPHHPASSSKVLGFHKYASQCLTLLFIRAQSLLGDFPTWASGTRIISTKVTFWLPCFWVMSLPFNWTEFKMGWNEFSPLKSPKVQEIKCALLVPGSQPTLGAAGLSGWEPQRPSRCLLHILLYTVSYLPTYCASKMLVNVWTRNCPDQNMGHGEAGAPSWQKTTEPPPSVQMLVSVPAGGRISCELLERSADLGEKQ